MKLRFITKTLILITCILIGFMVILAITWIWELITNDLIGKLFLTDLLLIMIMIIPTIISINIDEIDNEL